MTAAVGAFGRPFQVLEPRRCDVLRHRVERVGEPFPRARRPCGREALVRRPAEHHRVGGEKDGVVVVAVGWGKNVGSPSNRSYHGRAAWKSRTRRPAKRCNDIAASLGHAATKVARSTILLFAASPTGVSPATWTRFRPARLAA